MAEVKIELAKYRKRDGWPTRYWAVFVNGDLLAVTLYRKGALAVAASLTGTNDAHPVLTRDGQGDPSPATVPRSEA